MQVKFSKALEDALNAMDNLAKVSTQLGYFSKNLWLSMDHLKQFKINYLNSMQEQENQYQKSVSPLPVGYWDQQNNRTEEIGVRKNYQNREERSCKKRKLNQMEEEDSLRICNFYRAPRINDFEFFYIRLEEGLMLFARCVFINR